MAATGRTQHIRLRMPKLRGNQFYRARVTDEWVAAHVRTFCGADPTDLDLAWADRHSRWTKEHACQACVAAAEAVA